MALCCPACTSLHACHRRREPRGCCHPAAMSLMSLKIDVLEKDLLQRALAIGRANTRREQVCRGGRAGGRGRPIFSGSSAVKQAQPSVSLSYLCALCDALRDAWLRRGRVWCSVSFSFALCLQVLCGVRGVLPRGQGSRQGRRKGRGIVDQICQAG